MNKLVTITHGNPAYLGFAFNKKIDLIDGGYSVGRFGSDLDAYPSDHIARRIHEAASAVNLVKECSVSAYEVSVEIPDGFEADEYERQRVYAEVSDVLIKHLFGDDPVEVAHRDMSAKYQSSSSDDY